MSQKVNQVGLLVNAVPEWVAQQVIPKPSLLLSHS